MKKEECEEKIGNTPTHYELYQWVRFKGIPQEYMIVPTGKKGEEYIALVSSRQRFGYPVQVKDPFMITKKEMDSMIDTEMYDWEVIPAPKMTWDAGEQPDPAPEKLCVECEYCHDKDEGDSRTAYNLDCKGRPDFVDNITGVEISVNCPYERGWILRKDVDGGVNMINNIYTPCGPEGKHWKAKAKKVCGTCAQYETKLLKCGIVTEKLCSATRPRQTVREYYRITETPSWCPGWEEKKLTIKRSGNSLPEDALRSVSSGCGPIFKGDYQIEVKAVDVRDILVEIYGADNISKITVDERTCADGTVICEATWNNKKCARNPQGRYELKSSTWPEAFKVIYDEAMDDSCELLKLAGKTTERFNAIEAVLMKFARKGDQS